MNARDVIELHWFVGQRIHELAAEGLTGKQIAMELRDEGYPIQDVRFGLSEAGYHAEFKMFLELKALQVSDFPLLPGEEIPIYSGSQAGSQLTIWLGRRGPSVRKAYLN